MPNVQVDPIQIDPVIQPTPVDIAPVSVSITTEADDLLTPIVDDHNFLTGENLDTTQYAAKVVRDDIIAKTMEKFKTDFKVQQEQDFQDAVAAKQAELEATL